MEHLDEEKYQRALKRVKDIRDFYIHAFVYVAVITLLIMINYMTTKIWWVQYPAVGWGLGLGFHGVLAFGHIPFFGKAWEERKIKELMEKDN